MKKSVLLVLFLILFALGLTACDSGPKSLIFSNLALRQGETGIVTLSASNITGLGSVQIGPNGAIVYNSTVIEVVSVAGVNGFVVFASDIDNNAGQVTLAAGTTGAPISTGAIMEITVKALASANASTTVNASQVDFLLKVDGTPIRGFDIIPGKVNVIN